MDIAIVGTNFELQETDNFKQLWKYISTGHVLTKYELLNDKEKILKLQNYNLDKIKKFSPELFKYTSDQSKKMDPQHRRLLMLTYNMLHQNTHKDLPLISTLGKEVGVYTAVGMSYYLLKNLLPQNNTQDYTTYINNIPDTAASKISYQFNFHGPSLNFSSACSSSSLALYYAFNDLKNKKIYSAIVGASRLPVESSLEYQYKADSIFSKSGMCSPFDKNSDGMVPGFGSIVFALKRKEDAIKDNNNILAIIKGIGIANDGNEKASYTAPGISGQYEAINNAYKNSDIDFEDIDYLEAHGTGTAIGDAIEAESISKIFKNNLELGSIKANYGHLDNASSFLSILKAILMLHHQQIPAQANFISKNPLLKKHNISISKNLKPSKLTNIAINSFGIGGTNAHILLQKSDINNYNFSENNHSSLLSEKSYWIDSQLPIVQHSQISTSSTTAEEVIEFVNEYLGYDNSTLKQMPIKSLNMESYVLIDLIDELNNRFNIQFELSDFQELNDTFLDIVNSKLLKNNIENNENILHIFGDFIDSRKTLFLVHPAGGTVNGYNNFFKNKNNEYNIIFISFPFSNIEYVKYFSLEQLARVYKDKILSFIPSLKNEYFIGGYSFGGNIAFEIARQLQEEASIIIPEIIMIDSHPIEAYNHTEKKLITRNTINFALNEFGKQGVINSDLLDDKIDKYSKVWVINHKMLKEYTPPKVQLDSHLNILICKEDENKELLKMLGIKDLDKTIWQKRFKNKINTRYIEGNHYSIYSNIDLGTKVGEKITKIMENNK